MPINFSVKNMLVFKQKRYPLINMTNTLLLKDPSKRLEILKRVRYDD